MVFSASDLLSNQMFIGTQDGPVKSKGVDLFLKKIEENSVLDTSWI